MGSTDPSFHLYGGYTYQNYSQNLLQTKYPPNLNLSMFKTLECGIKTYHDHKQCPYFHTNKDRRRLITDGINLPIQTNVNTNYLPEFCPNMHKESTVCQKGDQCEYCHNTVE